MRVIHLFGSMAFRLGLPFACALLTLSACAAQPEVAGAVVAKGALVYTAPYAAPVRDGVVVIRDGKITAVGKAADVALPAGSVESACSGSVLTAGFQNSHVHFTEDRWMDAAHQPASVLSHELSAMLTRYGFSTVVDTASDRDNTIALRTRIDSGEVRGPRILTLGWPLYPEKGIPFYLLDMRPEFLARLSQPATSGEALAIVRHNLDRGADGTKLFVATPQRDRTTKYMPRDIVRAAVDETHRRGALAFAHPTDRAGLGIALDGGVDVIVHTTLEEGPSEWDAALIERMVKENLGVIPTLQLWRYELTKAGLPERIIGLAVGDTVEQLRAFSSAGGQVLFGTDVGYMAQYDPTEEYTLMGRAGLTPMQILASLTTAPAARWQESDRRGRLVAGADADLVVLDGDPAEDVINFAKVRCTMSRGRVVFSPFEPRPVK